MGKTDKKFDALKLKKLESTVREAEDGDMDVHSATFKAERKDGTQVAIKVRIMQPAKKGIKRNPFEGLLIGQDHDLKIGNDQTTLKMP